MDILDLLSYYSWKGGDRRTIHAYPAKERELKCVSQLCLYRQGCGTRMCYYYDDTTADKGVVRGWITTMMTLDTTDDTTYC